MPETHGILKNKEPVLESPVDSELSTLSQVDRKKVLENTMLNAQLFADNSKGREIREKIKEQKRDYERSHSQDSGSENRLLGEAAATDELRWDEANLYLNEQNKSATMKIDEPKTPYTGGVDPNGEYYQDDEGDDDAKAAALQIPGFSLGESEYQEDEDEVGQSINGGGVVSAAVEAAGDEESSPPSSPVETAEEKHRRFEEMRKKHYHLKGEALHKFLVELDDD